MDTTTVWNGKCPKCGTVVYWSGSKDLGPQLCYDCVKLGVKG